MVAIRSGASEPTLARDVVLAVEVLAPATEVLDRATKRDEYAAAGIPQYWIIDIDDQSAEVLTLVDGRYEGATVVGRIRTSTPAELDIDLTALVY